MALFRSDGWVKSALGQAVAGAQIYVCSQPTDVSFVPPIPEVTIFSDALGTPLAQPIITDGFGHYDFYVPYGTYTVAVVTAGKFQAVYPDQTIGFSTSGSGAVSSVFGRVGVVAAQAGDYSAFYDPLGAAAAAVVGLAPLNNPSFTGTIQIVNAVITGTLKDGGGSVGTPGQILSSTGTGTAWVTGSGTGTVTNTGTLTSNAIILGNGTVDIKAGSVLPGNPLVFLDGTGNFTAPSTGSALYIFYPETYGAIGNGIHDDTTAIQDAINACASAGGGTVVFGPKTYLTTAGLTISTTAVNMQGQSQGNSSIIACNSASADILTISSCYYNTLNNFRVQRTVSPNASTSGIKLNAAHNVRLVAVESWDSAFCIYQMGGSTICEYTQVQTVQSSVTTSAANTTIGSNPTGVAGWQMDGSAGGTGFFSTRLLDCVHQNIGTSATTAYGMQIYTSGAQGIADLYVEGFETAGCTYGVYIQGSGSHFNENLHFVRCIHDTIVKSAYYITGVNGDGTTPYVEINGGYCEGSNGFPNVDIENSQGVIVSSVDFLETSTAVYINGSSSTGNVIEGNKMSPQSGGSTLISLNNTNGNVISNNVINSEGTAFTTGIALAGSSYNLIQGNVIQGTASAVGTNGITLDSSSSNNLGANIVVPTHVTNPLVDAGTNNAVTVAKVSGGTALTTGAGFSPVWGNLWLINSSALSVAPSPGANATQAYMFVLDVEITINKIVYNVVSGNGAGDLWGFGIYSEDGNTKLIDSGALSTASAGIQTASLATPGTIGPGVYFFAQTTSGTTAQCRYYAYGSDVPTFLNKNAARVGPATNNSASGVLPTTLGAINTGGTPYAPMFVWFDN